MDILSNTSDVACTAAPAVTLLGVPPPDRRKLFVFCSRVRFSSFLLLLPETILAFFYERAETRSLLSLLPCLNGMDEWGGEPPTNLAVTSFALRSNLAYLVRLMLGAKLCLSYFRAKPKLCVGVLSEISLLSSPELHPE